jgi:hypothetical protein
MHYIIVVECGQQNAAKGFHISGNNGRATENKYYIFLKKNFQYPIGRFIISAC